MQSFPRSEPELEALLSRPSDDLVADLVKLDGDLIILGAGGKMGPSLATLARAGLDKAGRAETRVIAASRWSNAAAADRLREAGVEPLVVDLGVDADLAALPEAANVVYMVGAKFGSAANPGQAWMTNTVLTAILGRRYLGSRFTAFSTGNVYPLVPIGTKGCQETDPLGPVGEYAMSCLGRERVLGALSETHGLKASVIRLNYAAEPRYGVLCDIATSIQAGRPVNLANGYVNVVWQRYANEVVLRSLLWADSPPFVLNLTGAEKASVRSIANRLGTLLGREATFTGSESDTALLSNASKCHELFGHPDLALDELVTMQADWMAGGGSVLGKPTKFERQDGRF